MIATIPTKLKMNFLLRGKGNKKRIPAYMNIRSMPLHTSQMPKTFCPSFTIFALPPPGISSYNTGAAVGKKFIILTTDRVIKLVRKLSSARGGLKVNA